MVFNSSFLCGARHSVYLQKIEILSVLSEFDAHRAVAYAL